MRHTRPMVPAAQSPNMSKSSRYFSLKRGWRSFLASNFPFAFLRWVNRERCYVKVENDPDGCWTVQLGSHAGVEDETLGGAFDRAFWLCEHDPDWEWPSDYLNNLPNH